MRLIVTILWCLAALLWLPWLALLVRWLIDVAAGIPPAASPYYGPALIGLWPIHGWLSWGVVSVWPLCASGAAGLSALGWRLYWLDQDGIMPRPPHWVILSIVVPPLAPLLMWGDARRRHREREQRLSEDVADARARLRG